MNFDSASSFQRRAFDLKVSLLDLQVGEGSHTATPCVRFSIERAPYVAIALARRFLTWLGNFDTCDFWISEFGIWPSREDFNLYQRLRSTYGDDRELADAPTHRFGSNEKDDLATVLGIAIQFGWGGHIVADTTKAYIYLSHDGWVHVGAPQSHQRIKSDLSDLGIEYEALDA